MLMLESDKWVLSSEWQALAKLSEGDGLGDYEIPDLGTSLNSKIMWFLKHGPAGVLMTIKDLYGDEGLKEFEKFLNYYLSDPDTDGHYKRSYKVKNGLLQLKAVARTTDFGEYLVQLTEKLKDEELEQ